MWDIETVKSAVVSAIVAFVGSAMFYEIIKIGIKKLVEKLTGAVRSLKDEQIITQGQYTAFLTEVSVREDQLITKVGEVLDKLPDAQAISRIDTFWNSVSDKIDAFLNEIEVGDE